MLEGPSSRQTRAVDRVLWILLVLGFAINLMGQLAEFSQVVSLAAGIVGLLCGGVLAALAVARRRS